MASLARFVLVSDTTLSKQYGNFPLLDFLPCAPSNTIPSPIYNFLKGKPPLAVGGRALTAPLALRKLEAALLREHREEDVVVAHEKHLEAFIDDDTEVIGVYTMDPFGLGPLTVSYSVLFGSAAKPYVRVEFDALMSRLNSARRGKKAKIVVGGAGVWELTILPDEMDRLGIDYAYQGEADDIINELFDGVAQGDPHNGVFFEGYRSFDENFRGFWVKHERFICRKMGSKQFPKLEEIPLIRAPVIKGLVEVMRGCGIGCDFCEVTLRPLRYYTPEMVKQEIMVNRRAGYTNAWVHSDEIFAYEHGRGFEPNADALKELFSTIMSIKGIIRSNPTHGRISIPAGYPELIRELSTIMKTGPDNYVGMQVGLETGSERLAKIHMPNKTLPLKIGPDGSWPNIVVEGTKQLNRYYWRPAFTVQVGQLDETPEDNWETVALINVMSNSSVDGRPLEFTVIPMQNMPLGLIKSRSFSPKMLDDSQLAVYYASYRHLAKIASRSSFTSSKGGLLKRSATSIILVLGSMAMLRLVDVICRKRGLDIEKVKRFGSA